MEMETTMADIEFRGYVRTNDAKMLTSAAEFKLELCEFDSLGTDFSY